MTQRPLLIFLITVAIFTGLTVLCKQNPIEKDLTFRVQRALEQNGFSDLQSEANARELILFGPVDSAKDAERAKTIAQGVWGVRSVSDRFEISQAKPQAQNALDTNQAAPAQVSKPIEIAAPVFVEDKIIHLQTLADQSTLDRALCEGQLAQATKNGDILFESESSTPKQDSYATLNQIAEVIYRCPELKIEVDGHTDSTGSEPFNLALSEARAQAVRYFFIRAGIADSRLIACGFGSEQPIGDNATESGRAMNRRIELRTFE